MPIDIHVTVELQPSPQLVQLLEALQLGTQQPAGPEWPQIKPRKPQEEPNKDEQPISELDKFMKERKERAPLKEIPKFPHTDFTTPDFVKLEKYSLHLEYAETEDGRLVIKYDYSLIYTTWSDLRRLIDSLPNKFKFTGVKLLEKKTGNKPTALRHFIRAVIYGLRKGQAAGSQEDLDAEFRPVLNQSSQLQGDFGGGVEE